MKCPNDKTEMEKGFFDHSWWFSGPRPRGVNVFAIGRKAEFVTAWKCPKCGKIELYSQKIEK